MGNAGRLRVGRKIESPNKTLKVRCTTKRSGNFIYNKVYVAVAHSKHIGGGNYADFRIEDEDGDYYTIYEYDLGRLFSFVSDE